MFHKQKLECRFFHMTYKKNRHCHQKFEIHLHMKAETKRARHQKPQIMYHQHQEFRRHQQHKSKSHVIRNNELRTESVKEDRHFKLNMNLDLISKHNETQSVTRQYKLSKRNMKHNTTTHIFFTLNYKKRTRHQKYTIRKI